MLKQIGEQAKESMQIDWNEPRDRALHLLLFFFAVAAFLIVVERYSLFFVPELVRLFALQAALFLILIFLLAKTYRPRLRSRMNWVLIGVGGYFGVLFLTNVVVWLLGFSSPNTELFWLGNFRTPRLEDAFLGLLFAPILEELVFRDYLMRVLSWNGTKWGSAVLISTAFFTLAHFSLYPGAFFLGLINAVLFIRSGGILLPILFHFVCNLSWYFLPALFPHLSFFLESGSFKDLFYR